MLPIRAGKEIKFSDNVATQDTGLEPRFTFYDLKASGVSDLEGDKKAASGHKSERMIDVL